MTPLPSLRRSPATLRRRHDLLVDLLALNENMIGQLVLEQQQAAGTPDFLGSMILQHERVAGLIRDELARRRLLQPGPHPAFEPAPGPTWWRRRKVIAPRISTLP